MAENPWHPRLVPCLLYVLLLWPVAMLSESKPEAYVAGYALQCVLVAWLLWRYRALTEELTLRFHWLAVPVGVGVVIAWIAVGDAMRRAFPPAETEPHLFTRMDGGVRALSLGARLLGMSLLVPIFEELLIRSLMLRSFGDARRTWRALLAAFQEMPMIGEWLLMRRWSTAPRAGAPEDADADNFAGCFRASPMGKVTLFGATVSTVFFMFNHARVDWPGCVLCGAAYCWLVHVTHRRTLAPGTPAPGATSAPAIGLGPVIWAHGITNALLWTYCVIYRDWRFM